MSVEFQIVLAWTDHVQEVVREGRVDLGERHRFREVTVGKSAMWLNRGSAEDLAKACAYATKEQERVARESDSIGTSRSVYDVFVYPIGTKDPLGKARKDILKKVRA